MSQLAEKFMPKAVAFDCLEAGLEEHRDGNLQNPTSPKPMLVVGK